MIHTEQIHKLDDEKLWQLKNEIAEAMKDNAKMKEDRLTLKHYFSNIEKEVEKRILAFRKTLYHPHADVIDLIKKELQENPDKFHIKRLAVERGPYHVTEVVKIGKREFIFQ